MSDEAAPTLKGSVVWAGLCASAPSAAAEAASEAALPPPNDIHRRGALASAMELERPRSWVVACRRNLRAGVQTLTSVHLSRAKAKAAASSLKQPFGCGGCVRVRTKLTTDRTMIEDKMMATPWSCTSSLGPFLLIQSSAAPT